MVELNPGATVTGAEIIATCKAELGSIKSPKRVDFVASLPRSPVGKVLKREVKDCYWSGADRRIH